LSRARARARGRRAARAGTRRVPRGRGDDPLLLADPARGQRRHAHRGRGAGGPEPGMRRLPLVLLAVVAAGCGATASVRHVRPALQWPMSGVGPSRTQAQTEIHLRPPFRILWSRGTGYLAEFPAVVSEGVAYIGNQRGVVQALAMSNGRVLWKRRTPNGKMASSPAVWGDWLVVHGMDGIVRVLARSNGRVLARFSVGSPIESSRSEERRVGKEGRGR